MFLFSCKLKDILDFVSVILQNFMKVKTEHSNYFPNFMYYFHMHRYKIYWTCQ